MKTSNLIIACMACLAFGACSKEMDETAEPEINKDPAYPVRISTRTGGSDISKIGLYMVYGDMKGSGNYLNNISLTNNGDGNWTAARNIYWKDNNTAASFIGYAPFDGSISNAFEYEFSVRTDQSTTQALESCDFLWGKVTAQEPTENSIDMMLTHILSRVVVKVSPGDGFTEDELKSGNISVRLNGFCTNAVINLFDGVFSDCSSVAAITPCKEDDLQYTAIVIPQTIANSGIVTISINGSDYTLTRDLTVISGKRYTLTVTLNKSQGGINVGIGDWEDDGEDYGGTVN